MKKSQFSSREKEEILKQAQQFWNKATRAQEPFFELVNEMERLSRCLLPEGLQDEYDKYGDRSSLVPPDIHNNLASNRAFIRLAMFKKKPYFRLFIKGKQHVRGQVIDKAEQILQAILDSHDEGKGYDAVADKFINQALQCGLTATYTKWQREYERIVNRRPDGNWDLDENGQPQFRLKLVAQYPEVIPLDIRRTRIDPAADNRRNIRIAGYQGLEGRSELIRRQKSSLPQFNHYDFKVDDLLRSTFQRSKYFEYVPSESTKYPEKTTYNDTFGDEVVETWSIRGLFRFKRKDDTYDVKDLIVEVGNRDVLLAVKENDLPLAGWELFDYPSIDEEHGRLFTMGLIEPARDSFIEEFIKKNQAIDAANRNVYLTYLGDAAAVEGLPAYVEAAKDQIIKLDMQASGQMDVKQALSVLDRPQLGQDVFQHSQVLSREVQQTMKLSSYRQGIDPASADTATAVAELVSGGEVLTDHVIKKLTDTAFRPHVLKIMRLWNFFVGHKKSQVYMPDIEQEVDIEPMELDLPWQMTAETNLSATFPAMVRRFVEMYPNWRLDPIINDHELVRTALDMLDIPNRDRLLVSKEHQKLIADRESIALAYGIELPVHPLDPHDIHLESHMAQIEFLQKNPNPAMTTDVLVEHSQAHQIEIQKRNTALGNTKEMGGNAGNFNQPDSASIKSTGQGKTGGYMPQEGRK